MSEPASETISDTTAPLPSATVILLRDGPDGLEALLVRRHGSLTFHGGALAFPGGRVDDDDLAGTDGDPGGLAVARAAAAREVREETSIEIDPSELLAWSHWTTPPGRPRRYATWFLVAAVTEPVAVQVDGGEIVGHRWSTPRAALDAAESGSISLAPATWVTLYELSGFTTATDVVRAAKSRDPAVFEPRDAQDASGRQVSVYRQDAAWPDGDADRSGDRHRLVKDGTGYRYERSITGEDGAQR